MDKTRVGSAGGVADPVGKTGWIKKKESPQNRIPDELRMELVFGLRTGLSGLFFSFPRSGQVGKVPEVDAGDEEHVEGT